MLLLSIIAGPDINCSKGGFACALPSMRLKLTAPVVCGKIAFVNIDFTMATTIRPVFIAIFFFAFLTIIGSVIVGVIYFVRAMLS